MYQPTDLKKGTVIQLDGTPYRVVDYSQKVMGRGGSIVNVRLKNLIDDTVMAKTFKGADKIEPAEVTSRKAQYLYSDGDNYYFMDPDNFEQFQLSAEVVEAARPFLREGDVVDMQFFGDRIIAVELPKNVFLKVTYAEDVVRGDTTSGLQKEVTLETGHTLKVPAFIKAGDEVKVDTRTGDYLERKKD